MFHSSSRTVELRVNSVTALPILLRTREESKPCVPCLPSSPSITDKKRISLMYDTQFSSDSVAPRFIRRTIRVDSSLRRFGVHKRRTTRYMMFSTGTDNIKTTNLVEDVVSEENEYTVSCKILSLGIRWAIGLTYSRVLSSISVFPVVKSFPNRVHGYLSCKPIECFQQMFSSGQVHPFTRDDKGRSLLHVRPLPNFKTLTSHMILASQCVQST